MMERYTTAIDFCEEYPYGITAQNYLNGLILNECDKLNHPIVFITKYPKDFILNCQKCKRKYNCDTYKEFSAREEEEEEFCEQIKKQNHHGKLCKCLEHNKFSNQYHRIESTVFYEHWVVECQLAREVKNSCGDWGFPSCRYRDALAAEYFLGEGDTNYNMVKKRIIKELSPKDCNQKNHRYIQYVCKCSGYIEFAFPVIVQGITVGVMVSGQLLSNRAENIEQHKKFLHNLIAELNNKLNIEDSSQPGTKYKSYLAKRKIEDLNEKLRQLNSEEAEDTAFELENDKTIEDVIDKMCDATGKVEKELIARKRVRIERLIYRINMEAQKKFVSELDNKIITITLADANNEIQRYIDEYFKLVEKALTVIKKGLRIESFTFASNVQIAEKFIREHNPEELTNIKINNKSGEKFAVCADTEDKNFQNIIYTSINNAGTFHVVFRVADTHFLIEENTLFKEMMMMLSNRFNGLVSRVVAQYHEKRLDKFITIMRHELGQTNDSTNILIKRQVERLERLRKLIEKEEIDLTELNNFHKGLTDFIKAIEGDFHSFMIRIKETRYTQGIPDPNYEYFYPYDEFLFKWSGIYRRMTVFSIDELRRQEEHRKEEDRRFEVKKFLKFDFPVVQYSDRLRPLMYADPHMIEQVSFNLTNNAFKYALPGTKITFDCCLNEKEDKYLITVTNYAEPMDKEDREKIFEFGIRGKNHGSKSSSGLGCYISKEIMKKHKGGIALTQKVISNYNIPLIPLYLEMPKDYQKPNDAAKLTEIMNKLKKSGEWDKIIGQKIHKNSRSPFTPLNILSEINKHTARVQFQCWIPHVPII